MESPSNYLWASLLKTETLTAPDADADALIGIVESNPPYLYIYLLFPIISIS